MRQDCVKIVCDRCGEELVVEAKNGTVTESQAKDWNLNGISYTGIKHDFCPECAVKWKGMMWNFWGEKKYD
jgi:hypothetical protein